MSDQPMCFTCKIRPAGNDYAGVHSAYCAACQPRPRRQQPRGAQCGCSACGRLFATLTDFDRHQERWTRGHQLEWVLAPRCVDPTSVGLVDVGGVWGTAEGNANRARKTDRLRAMRGVPVVI